MNGHLMTLTLGPEAWIPAVLAIVGAAVWLIRLEGRVLTLAAQMKAVESAGAVHTETRDQVIRMTVQIENLVRVIERLPRPRRRSLNEGD